MQVGVKLSPAKSAPPEPSGPGAPEAILSETVMKPPESSAPHLEVKAPLRMQVRCLNFFYGQEQALRNINLDIATNCVTALIGPSGCGKSTLLRTLNRMHET